MKLSAFSWIWLAIFLTPLSLFGQAKREALVTTAFAELPGIIQFLTRSYDFDQRLTVEERQQLHTLYSITETIALEKTFGATKQPMPKIQFSNDPKPFELAPGQPERSATTTSVLADPIMFNLRILNAPHFDASYLDILQILFHELGHKLGPSKNQLAMDSLGAKFIQFVKPYYQHALLDGRIKLEVLSLPVKLAPSTYGAAPLQPNLLVQENGFVVSHRIDYSTVGAAAAQFTASPAGSGNISEQVTVRITGVEGSAGHPKSLRFESQFQVEATSRIVFTDPEIRLSGVGASLGGQQYVMYQDKNHTIVEPSTSSMSLSAWIGRPEPKWSMSQTLPFEGSTWNYRDLSEKFRVTAISKTNDRIQIQISQAENILSAFLRLESAGKELLIKGNPSTTSPSNYLFELPANLTSSSGEIRISDVVVNQVGTIPLTEVIQLQVPKESKRLQIEKLHVYDGSTWVEYDSRSILKLPAGPIKYRIEVSGDGELSQIRLLWNKGRSLFWNSPDQVFGTHSQTQQEVISKFSRPSPGVYEFTSSEVLHTDELKTAKGVVGSFDSKKRFLKRLSVVSANLEGSNITYSPHLKIYNREFMQVGSEPRVVSCRKIH